jgi:hypothetical protein
MATTALIDTKTVERRRLRFNSLSEVIAEAERLAAAEKAGKVTRLGNWTTGQIFNHLASWANYPYDGYPSQLGNPPWFIKLFLKFQKNKFINGGMPQGIHIPRVTGGTVGTEPMGVDEGLEELRASLKRLEAGPPSIPNPIFGAISHHEWKNINTRHAELHLGYLKPG